MRLVLITVAFILSVSSLANVDRFIKDETVNLLVKKSSPLTKAEITQYLEESEHLPSSQYIDFVFKKLKDKPRVEQVKTLVGSTYGTISISNRNDPCLINSKSCTGGLYCSSADVEYPVCKKKFSLGEACESTSDLCSGGKCVDLENFSSVSLCQSGGATCKSDGECCSSLCDNGECRLNIQCSSCVEKGGVPREGQLCCDNLYKNSKGYCSPILPFAFKLFNKLLGVGVNEAIAGEESVSSEDNISSRLLKGNNASDFRQCRVNLFGDFLASKDEDYINGLFASLRDDYMTGGEDLGDAFYIRSDFNTARRFSNSTAVENQKYNWIIQTRSILGDGSGGLRTPFSPEPIVKGLIKDQFDSGPAVGAEKAIENYLNALSDDRLKIFLFLFENGFVTKEQQKKIEDYFAYKKEEDLKAIPLRKRRARGRYNIRDVIRFEAVKEKLALIEQYSSLKAKSIQMMCRCVDTIGPIEGNNWIKSDVESDYVKYCNNVGRYLTLPSDTLSDRVDVYSSCLQDSSSGCKLTSRYNEFVKEGEVMFPEGTESRIKQIDFNTFLSDLAIEKLDVITKASLVKVGAGGDLLAHMSNFINNANWNYVKYTASKKSVTKKCLLPVCHILDSNILGGFGTKIMAGIVNVASLGFVLGSTSNMDIYSTKERVTTVEKCSPLAKEKDWKKWGVKIGKKKTYSCIKYVAVPNDVCGINSPVFLCGRNVYRYDKREGGDGSFQLDPLLPAQEHLYVNNKYRSKERVRYKKKIGKLAEHIFSRENSFFIHDHAIGFFKNSVIYKAMGENSHRDELSSSFAELAMKAMDYKKVWRKKNTPVHKFTLMPGLNLPLAVRSTEGFLASNREKDLNTADAYADYAINMNRFAVKTKIKALQNNDAALMVENINDSFSSIQNAQSETEKASSSFASWLNSRRGGMSSYISSGLGGSGESGSYSALKSSQNAIRSTYLNGRKFTAQRKKEKTKENELMKNALTLKGKAKVFERLQEVARQKARGLNTVGGIYSKMRRGIGVDAISLETVGVKAFGLDARKQGEVTNSPLVERLDHIKSFSKKLDNSNNELVINFENLNDAEDLFGLDDDENIFLGGEVYKAHQLKRLVSNASEEKELEDERRSLDEDYERRNTNLFNIISARYRITALPQFSKKRSVD